MAITSPVYCCREDVASALDIAETLRDNALVDSAVMAAAEDIHGLMHRRFYPEDGTKFWDWPSYQSAYPWRIWFEQHDLVSATSVTSGGQAISLADIFFEPANKEASEPYEYMELDLSTSAAFGVGSTPQHDIAIAGTWGYGAQTAPAGAFAGNINSSVTTATVTNSAMVGTGQILLCGTERMLVTDRAMTSSGQTLQTGMTADMKNQTVACGDGTQFGVGETLLLDAERMLITDIAGNSLVVKRARHGSTLAAHSGSTIYAPRLVTITRGALGTTAASHVTTDALLKFVFPGLLTELAVALSLNNVLQKTSGYSRTVGEGDNVRNASGAALAGLVSRAVARYGRKSRLLVI